MGFNLLVLCGIMAVTTDYDMSHGIISVTGNVLLFCTQPRRNEVVNSNWTAKFL